MCDRDKTQAKVNTLDKGVRNGTGDGFVTTARLCKLLEMTCPTRPCPFGSWLVMCEVSEAIKCYMTRATADNRSAS